jgi:hypothetical protein
MNRSKKGHDWFCIQFVISFLLMSAICFSQETWQKTIGESTGMGIALARTADGLFVVCGYTDLSDLDSDIYLAKVDSRGEKVWDRTFGDSIVESGFAGRTIPYIEICRSIQTTTDSGFILTGERWTFGGGNRQLLVIKLDESGRRTWEKAFNFGSWIQRGFRRGRQGIEEVVDHRPTLDNGESIIQTNDGGFAIAGTTEAQNESVLLVKLNKNGALEWEKRFGAENASKGYDIEQTKDGDFVVVGATDLSSEIRGTSKDVYVVKTTSKGELIWQKSFGRKGNQEGRSMSLSRDGSCIVVGYTDATGKPYLLKQMYLLRIDADGNLLHSRTLLEGTAAVGNSVIELENGNLVITGSEDRGLHESPSGRHSDIHLVETSRIGEVVWARTLGGPLDDAGFSAQEDSTSYLIAGYTQVVQSQPRIFLIRTNKVGQLLLDK